MIDFYCHWAKSLQSRSVLIVIVINLYLFQADLQGSSQKRRRERFKVCIRTQNKLTNTRLSYRISD